VYPAQWSRAGRRLAIVFACAALVGAGLTGCTSSSSASDSGQNIKIGVLDPLSGPDASLGNDSLHGAQLAANVIDNGLAGAPLPLTDGKGLPKLHGAKITIVPLDTHGTATNAVTGISHLVNDEHVAAVEGADESGVTLATARQAERLGIPFINGDSTSVTLTQQGFTWFFRTGPTDAIYAQPFFSQLQKLRTAAKTGNKIAILYSNDQFGNDGSKVIQGLAASNGEQVVANVPFDPASTDLISQMQQVRAAKPDALFVFAYPPAAKLMLNAFNQLGYVPNGVFGFGGGFSDPGFVASAGEGLEGLARRATWSQDLANRNPAAKAVAALFQKQYNAAMADNSARTFTAIMALAQAINNAASTDPNQIRSALTSLNIAGRNTIMPWDGIKFDDQHQNTEASAVVEQFVRGQWHIVYPDDVASRPISWPADATRTGD
jgi:branched-chain amino acid transport system substrate-binding protein